MRTALALALFLILAIVIAAQGPRRPEPQAATAAAASATPLADQCRETPPAQRGPELRESCDWLARYLEPPSGPIFVLRGSETTAIKREHGRWQSAR